MSGEPSENAKKLAFITSDLTIYAPNCLKILNKKGDLVPFELNRGQQHLHDCAEDMLARKGYVRIIVIKGRQQGVSTYIEARFYYKGSFEYGKRIFIMTHEDKATTNLFNMVKRFNDNVPRSFRPHVRFDNAKELYFDKLDTRYSVSTAGARATGRSATAQYMHGSEVAFWEDAKNHMAGIGQTVPMEDGTEIYLESTGNGIGNTMHQMCLDAIAGNGDYEFVFIPWFWQEEYQRPVPEGTVFDQEELEYKAAFDLTDGQLYWRRMKLVDDFGNDASLFDQEYPGTPEMAFMAGTSKALISPIAVNIAVSNKEVAVSKLSPIIIGVDPAEYGDDKTAIVIRWGRKVVYIATYHGEGNAEIAGRVALLIDKWNPDAVCIDVTGVGTGVEAFLSDQGYPYIYRIHNGEVAIEPEKYRNHGAEMWALMRDWFIDKTARPSLPRNLELMGELSSRGFHYDAGRRLVLQSKEDMRNKGIKSPNIADALSLTFGISVKPRSRKETGETLTEKLRRLSSRNSSGGTPGMGA